MPSTMVDAAAPPRLKSAARRRLSASTATACSAAAAAAAALCNANADTNAGAVAATTKPRAKPVASRYLAASSKPSSVSISAPASSASSTAGAASPAPRRPSSNAAAAASSASPAATRRTLSVAFQSPTYSLDTSRAARSASPAAAAAPERRRSVSITGGAAARGKVSDAGQNTYLWPASAAAPPPCGHDGAGRALAGALGFSASTRKQSAAVRSTASDGAPRRASVDGANEYLRALSSDTDSASSGGSRDGGVGAGAGPPRASPWSVRSSSARFTRDAVGTRSDRFASPATPSPSSRTPAAASPSPVKKKMSLLNSLLSSPFRKPSPSKSAASPSRARGTMETPVIAAKLQCRSSSTDCQMDGDVRVKPPGVAKAEEEHQLRLLYTRHLQWRLANAKAGAALSSKTRAAEETLFGAWIAMLRMRKSVAMRKLQLQLFRRHCKLMAILRGQMAYLEEWSSLERDYTISLSGSTEALNATVLRLPVSDGAMADIQALKNAVGFAVDVMQTIGNSTSTQLSKVGPGKCLGVPALQSGQSRTHSDGTVQGVVVQTSINARDVQQPTGTKDTADPKEDKEFLV
ncbi:hypothetical protein ACP4OV_012054 [Aristida adscensionis]